MGFGQAFGFVLAILGLHQTTILDLSYPARNLFLSSNKTRNFQFLALLHHPKRPHQHLFDDGRLSTRNEPKNALLLIGAEPGLGWGGGACNTVLLELSFAIHPS